MEDDRENELVRKLFSIVFSLVCPLNNTHTGPVITEHALVQEKIVLLPPHASDEIFRFLAGLVVYAPLQS